MADHGYLGREWCGCLSLLVVDVPHAMRDARGRIAALKKRGGTWERMTIEECRSSGPMRCPEHEALEARKKAAAQEAR